MFAGWSARASISVSAGNDTGISPATMASEPSSPPNPAALSGRDGYAKLTTPVLTELRRLDENRVKVKWTCAQPGFSTSGMQNVKLVILRQASTGEWQPVETRAWSGQGEWIDAGAPIATIWRYSAITTFINPGFDVLDAGSDAAPPRELDYGEAIYGILAYRGGLSQYTWMPPGHNLTGPKSDWFQTQAFSFDGQAPSFIPTNPALPSGQDAPLIFKKEGTRYFPEYEPADNFTELSTAGYVIRGRPFKIQAQALVVPRWEPREQCLIGFPPLSSIVQPNRDRVVGTGAAQMSRYLLNPTEIEALGTRFTGPEDKGFDNATYFASQHLRGGVPPGDATRRLKILLQGTGFDPNVTKQGPLNLSNKTKVADGIEFDLQATGNTLDASGKVTESATNRELKVVTLEARNWTVALYPVVIYDAQEGIFHLPPALPDANTLQNALNDIFGKQAGVKFNVVPKPQITVSTADFSQYQFPALPAEVNSMKAALWNASAKEDLTLFWVGQLKGENTIAQAFGIPSSGAVIGPSGSTFAVAHEMGHCFGLFHCWSPNSDSALTKIADRESKRLMGYDKNGSKLLRSKEIIKVNARRFDDPAVPPLGPLPAP